MAGIWRATSCYKLIGTEIGTQDLQKASKKRLVIPGCWDKRILVYPFDTQNHALGGDYRDDLTGENDQIGFGDLNAVDRDRFAQNRFIRLLNLFFQIPWLHKVWRGWSWRDVIPLRGCYDVTTLPQKLFRA